MFYCVFSSENIAWCKSSFTAAYIQQLHVIIIYHLYPSLFFYLPLFVFPFTSIPNPFFYYSFTIFSPPNIYLYFISFYQSYVLGPDLLLLVQSLSSLYSFVKILNLFFVRFLFEYEFSVLIIV